MSSAPIPTPIAVSELDKILIQDLLTERARIRTAIHTDSRIIGVGVVGVLGIAWNAKTVIPITARPEDAVSWSASWVLVLMVLLVLAVLFLLHLEELRKELKAVNAQLVAQLKPLGQIVPEDYMVNRAKEIVKLSLIFFALTVSCLIAASEYNGQALRVLQLQRNANKSIGTGQRVPATSK